jgi:hypothetical protein
MVPTPQPIFNGFIQESAGVEREQNQTTPMSLLEVGAKSQERKAVSAAAAAAQAALQKASVGSISTVAAAQAALQKSAVQNSIIKQTVTFPHHEYESEEARQRRHRRWLMGGGNSDLKKGLAMDPPLVEVDYAFSQQATYPHSSQEYDVAPRRPVAAALQTQTHESAATASHETQENLMKQQPYNMLPPPPGPPPKGPPMRHDFRVGNVCPAHAPCNCYCHCKAPPASLQNWKPTHDQPHFEG